MSISYNPRLTRDGILYNLGLLAPDAPSLCTAAALSCPGVPADNLRSVGLLMSISYNPRLTSLEVRDSKVLPAMYIDRSFAHC
jgi:hypothetical protein